MSSCFVFDSLNDQITNVMSPYTIALTLMIHVDIIFFNGLCESLSSPTPFVGVHEAIRSIERIIVHDFNSVSTDDDMIAVDYAIC